MASSLWTGDLETNDTVRGGDKELLISSPQGTSNVARTMERRWRTVGKISGLVALIAAMCAFAQHLSHSPATLLSSGTSEVVEEFFRRPKLPGRDQKNNGKKGGRFAAVLHARMKRRAEKKLLHFAAKQYSEHGASAMAAFAKMSYCGNLPGVYASLATTCSPHSVLGTFSICEPANITVVPGLVRTFSLDNTPKLGTVYGVMARIENTTKSSAFSNGVVVAIRGSINEFGNGVRDKQTRMEKGPAGCKDCNVHQGYHSVYHAAKSTLLRHLLELNCLPGTCTVYVAGHAAGGAVAALFAWELDQANFTIGTSYIYEPPQLGDAQFAKQMGQRFAKPGMQGPIFSVTHGKDSIPRWPFEPEFKTWGFEAYYADDESTKYSQLCFGGRKNCGIHKIPAEDLTTKDACNHPKAPDGSFCKFKGYIAQCWGGLSHQYVDSVPLLWQSDETQPEEQSAADWSPAEADGEQKLAMKFVKKVARGKSQWRADYYNLKSLKAFAALSKAAYCGGAPGFAKTVENTCKDSAGVCANAGFGIVPKSVVGEGIAYQSNLSNPYFMEKTLFFYTALIRRTTAEFADKPYFMPSEACVLAFRGSANLQNSAMNRQMNQTSLDDCTGCTVNQGINDAWKEALEMKVLKALRRSGCETSPKRERTANVFITGHSMGGTVGTLAAYYLQKAGFEVQLSWMIESGRAGNDAFFDHLTAMLTMNRPVPFWLTTHTNDKIPRTGSSIYRDGPNRGLGRYRFMVHFNSSDPTKHTLCMGIDGSGPNTTCGVYQFSRGELEDEIPNKGHCDLPFAPGGQICMLQQSSKPKYQLAPQCFWGGSM